MEVESITTRSGVPGFKNEPALLNRSAHFNQKTLLINPAVKD